MYCTPRDDLVILQKGIDDLLGRGSGYKAGNAGFKESMRSKTRVLAFWECHASRLLGVELAPSDPPRLQDGAYSLLPSVLLLVMLLSPPDSSDIVVGEEEMGTVVAFRTLSLYHDCKFRRL